MKNNDWVEISLDFYLCHQSIVRYHENTSVFESSLLPYIDAGATLNCFLYPLTRASL